MKPPKPHRLRATATLLTALPLVAMTAVAGSVPAHAEDPLPIPAIRYTFDDADSARVANQGSLGEAFDARVRNAAALARGTGPTAGTGASGLFPGGPQNSSRDDNSYLDIPAGLFEDTQAMTVSTWIKWNGANSTQLPWAYIVGSDALPADNWGMYFIPNEDGQSKSVANSGAEVKAVSPSPLPTNRWVHITSVSDGTSLSYYLNGTLVRTEAAPLDFTKLSNASSTRSGLIGRVPWAGPWAAFFGGEFDDFSIYKDALSSDQVARLFSDYVGDIVSVERESFAVTTAAGVAPALPVSVNVVREAGLTTTSPIRWEPIDQADYQQGGNVFTVSGSIDGWAGALTATVTVNARLTTPIAADFGADTGEFRGGASGTLYGLGDEGSPTQALVNGAAMTNVSQKPPHGTQHPGGDAFNIEDAFFDKHGKDLYVYTQDYYPDWPYNGGRRPGDTRTYTRGDDGRLTGEYTNAPNGLWDYLEVLEIVVEEVALKAEHPERFVFIPFNELDLQWLNNDDLYNRYLHLGNQPDSFTPGGASDWAAAWKVIADTYAKHGLERPRIAGPGDAAWRGEANIKAFLKAAIATDTVPDVYVWHELRGYQWLPERAGLFRRYAGEMGLAAADIPEINITEWGASSDMSSPANLLRWFASFEAAKADAQTAYWTASGTMSDNQAKVNDANGGWWLFKWYGDLMGSRTVAVTTGQQQAIAAVDRANARAQVIVGGIPDGRDGALTLKGLDAATFGTAVDVEVREVLVNGTDGVAATPRVVTASDGLAVVGGQVQLRIPSANSSSAYQVIVTPAGDRDVVAAQAGQAEYHVSEAETLRLTDAQVRTPSGYRASGDRDVSGFNVVGSRADWTVTVKESGLYRLQVLGATPGRAVQHALFVDEGFRAPVQYGANAVKPSNVRTVARGTATAEIHLEAGRHTLSLRTSKDGAVLLPGAGLDGGVTLDRFELTRLGDAVDTEHVAYPASTFRLFGEAELVDGGAELVTGGRADLYPSTHDSGYHDVTVDWAGAAGSHLSVSVNGRTAATFAATGRDQRSSVRVHLPQGISEFELTAGGGATVAGLSTTRMEEADSAIVRVEAEDLAAVTLGGTANVTGFGSELTNGSGTGYVTGLGITDADPANEGTLTIGRPAGIDKAGSYNAVVHFSNDDIEGTHDYNPQVVDLGLQASEEGGSGLAGRTTFRYTYAATNFWEAVMPLELSTDGGAITFGNTRSTLFIDEGSSPSTSDDRVLPGYAIAPDVDWIALAPFVLSTTDDVVTVEASLKATTRCVAGKVTLVATVTNDGDVPLDAAVVSPYGKKNQAALAPGRSVSAAFSTRKASVPGGTVSAEVTASGQALALEAPFGAASCG